MNKIVTRRDIFFGLTLILVAALVLRLWGIWFGLPFSFRADEYHEVYRALQLGTGGFNLDRTGKGGYYFLLFFEYGVLFVSLKLAGVVATAQDFARYYVSDPTPFYLIGRATTAVVGTINVFLVYRLGGRAYGAGAGILAAIFLTVDALSAEHSHYITVDVPMTCLATASLLFAVRMATDGKPSDYLWAALFAALATTTKLPGVLLLVPLLIAHIYYVRQQDGYPRQLLLARNLWVAAAVFIVVLAVTSPGLFMDPPLRRLGLAASSADIDEDLPDLINVPSNLFIYYFFVIKDSMGWPLFAVSMGGIIYALWQRTATDVILVSFAAVNYVVFASEDSLLFYPRYMLPVIVVLLLLAGRVVHACWPQKRSVMQAAAIVIVGILVAFPAYDTMANNHLLTQTDTRMLAKTWFEENVPEGSRVMIEGVKIEPSGLTVPLRDTAANLRAKIDYYKTREPGKAKYLTYFLQVYKGASYDLELMKRSDLQSVDFYKARGVRYFVVRPEAFERSRRMGTTGRDFLEDLNADPDIKLLKSFRADPRSRPGPDIDIYEFHSRAENPSP